jgi:hypothetical protein
MKLVQALGAVLLGLVATPVAGLVAVPLEGRTSLAKRSPDPVDLEQRQSMP